MNTKLREFVRQRARGRCEYCVLPQDTLPGPPFHIDHIRPEKHHGKDDAGNLCQSCDRCNLRKGTDFSGFDPETDQITLLFNPRTDDWHEHFRCEGPLIIGVTAVDRTTVDVLGMNEPERLRLRRQLILIAEWPPRLLA